MASSSREFRMAFDGHQSTFADSLFPTSQQQEQNIAASYTPWSPAHDDPYGLINFAQNSIKSRKPADGTDCFEETDLQGLVSNILDEADSPDSYYNEGSLPLYDSIWSPKKEDQPEAKTQHLSTFPPNYVSCEASSKAQAQSVDDFYQQSNGRSTNQQWLFNLPNGDQDSYTFCPQKAPPGLPLPNKGNAYMSTVQQNKYDTMPAEKDRGNVLPVDDLADLSNTLRPQSEMNNPYFHPYHDDQHTQSGAKPISNEQYGPQDINQLISRFQSFMAGEHDGLYRGDFPNFHRQTMSMQHEDSMAEQPKITSPAMSTQSTPVMQTQKQLVGEYMTVQMERNGGVRKQTFNRDTFQDLPGFIPQTTEHFQPPKPFSAPLNLPNQFQSNMPMYRETASPPINMNQYSKHHMQQGLMQSRLKTLPQMQRETKRMHMSGFLREGFSPRPPTNSGMRWGDKTQALSQNPNFDHLGSMQSQRSDGEQSMGIHSVGNTQQLKPFIYPVNDPRIYGGIPITSPNFSARSTLPSGSGVSGMDVIDMMSASESVAFNAYVNDMLTCKGQSPFHSMVSAMRASMVMNEGVPVIQLYFYMDKCYEQWRCLERERKKAEVILSKAFPGKRTAAVGHANLPKTPPNSIKVDQLIANQMREQAKVASLLDRMERLCNTPLHMNIYTAQSRHHLSVCITQERRKEEISSISKHQQQRAHFSGDRDILLMIIALRDLAATTRKMRTALWCALQMTLPKPAKRPDHQVNTERCSSPCEGYSFKI